jgi:hypothetical protein
MLEVELLESAVEVGESVSADVQLVAEVAGDVTVGHPAEPGGCTLDAALEPLELFELCLPVACQRRPLGRQGPGAGDVGFVEPDVEVPPLLGELPELGGDGLLGAGPGHAGGEARVGVVGLVEVGVDLVEVLVEDGLVEVVGLAAAGEGDVAPFSVEGLGAEDVGVVDGEPLGFVAGDRIPVGDMAGVEIVAVEDDRAAVVGDRVDLPSVRVEMGDGGAGAVDDPEPTVVAQAHDPVTDCISAPPPAWRVGPVRRRAVCRRARARWLRSSTSARRSPMMIDPAGSWRAVLLP